MSILAVGAGCPQDVRLAARVEAAGEHEKVVGKSIDIGQGLWIDRLFERQTCNQTFGPADDGPGVVKMSGGGRSTG